MMQLTVNPLHSDRADTIRIALEGGGNVVKTFCNNRNTVELVTVEGEPMVLKRYKPMGLLRGAIYTWFARNKARRAYENALRLTDIGFSTPAPLGYAEIRRNGILREVRLLSEFCPDDNVTAIYHVPLPVETLNRLAGDLAKFIGNLHKSGVALLDLNPTNVLCRCNDNGHYSFRLIDINRMTFGHAPGMHSAMKAIYKMGMNVYVCSFFLPVYAYERGWDADRCACCLFNIRNRTERWQRFKRKLFRNK